MPLNYKKLKPQKCPFALWKGGEEDGIKVWNIAEERPKEVKKYFSRGSRALVTDPDAPAQFWVPQGLPGGESPGEGCLQLTMEMATPGSRYTTDTRLCSEQHPGRRIQA